MDAIEFKTKITNNGVIQLPESYINLCQGQVKVIILKEEESSTKDEVARQYAKVKAIIEEIQD